MVFQEEADKIKNNFRKKLIGEELEVLFENRVKQQNIFFGRDRYFNAVVVKSDIDLKGKIKAVKINHFNSNTLFGEVLKEKNIKNFAA